jgi:hypothetical protein
VKHIQTDSQTRQGEIGMSGRLSSEAKGVVVECGERMAEILARPDPPAWKTWEAVELDELRRCGPRYTPAAWFGDGQPLPERVRVRFLRAVLGLEEAGLVKGTKSAGGRLTFLRLTPEGERVYAEITGKPAPSAKRPQTVAKKAAKDLITNRPSQ